MPKMQAKIAISRTTRRFLKQSATNWSIIEPHRSLDHYSLAGLKTNLDNSSRTLLVGDFDISAFERPFCDLYEDARPVVGHQECRGWHNQTRHWRRNEGRVRKHVGLHHLVRIVERDTDLIAPGVGLDHVADKQHLAAEHLVRVSREGHVDGLPGEDERNIFLRYIGRNPDRLQVRDRHRSCGQIIEERTWRYLQINQAAGDRRLHCQ